MRGDGRGGAAKSRLQAEDQLGLGVLFAAAKEQVRRLLMEVFGAFTAGGSLFLMRMIRVK